MDTHINTAIEDMQFLNFEPGWPLIKKIFCQGHWTEERVELFGQDESKATHIHFYTRKYDEAKTMWKQVRHLIPTSIITASIQISEDDYSKFDPEFLFNVEPTPITNPYNKEN